VLLGDFNIHNSRDDISMKALVENGFVVPDDIRGLSTNTGKDEGVWFPYWSRCHTDSLAKWS